MERDVASVVGLVRPCNKGLLMRSLEFNLRAVTFRGKHYGIWVCVLEELLQLQCGGWPAGARWMQEGRRRLHSPGQETPVARTSVGMQRGSSSWGDDLDVE